MTYKWIIAMFAVIISISILGCENKEEIASREKGYKTFVKKRQEKTLGVDIEALKAALKKYPEFKSMVNSGEFNPETYRDYARQNNIDAMNMLTLFFVIQEISDSVKVPSGKKYLEKKYKPKVVELVAKNLGLQG